MQINRSSVLLNGISHLLRQTECEGVLETGKAQPIELHLPMPLHYHTHTLPHSYTSQPYIPISTETLQSSVVM